ncbi:HPr kinase/phosphorylase HprK [Peptoclostridium acidaminophilum DSM 3953]|uniref:HPr kinase/phosphorylase n=2 Tax=Peptoclostridium acidaminophilum TaxID=1731 RepID=HPRK_PEPAC|nr:HPr(Ser) kinase/phosphatase [Peptoclostridium acidaminophilum]Q93SG0.1 RecName: Full=HPr kinase/phosphorylase; Short=HPrK/P; AltName: Full=HPr(Ser) kinase/phosphorylase [Peptoclostridium acidaminophilum]AHM55730.1 HPr kinase/phosphorylase HprK [Peptoclostridium acidaminophilum DSM 3953]CAC39228.1 HprK protein [Peptoclostridium acidaminophilum DSM 3953]
MTEDKKVSVSMFIKELELEVVHKGENTDYEIISSDINRPALQFAGFFEHFAYDRVQVIGKGEHDYFGTLDRATRLRRLEKLFSYEIPVLVLARGLDFSSDTINMAKKYNRIIIRSQMSTTKFINKASGYLSEKLAPSKTVHGVLVDIYGIGVLLMGKSGVGKSETALELVKRGHRLVADDAVEIRRIEDDMLVGEAPDILKYLMEIRGVGILDIKNLYGVGAIRTNKVVEMVAELEYWEEGKYYDRLGIDEEYMTLLDVPVEKIVIPVKPGRNLAMIIEVAAKNYRQKNMGYNAAKIFNEKLLKKLSD